MASYQHTINITTNNITLGGYTSPFNLGIGVIVWANPYKNLFRAQFNKLTETRKNSWQIGRHITVGLSYTSTTDAKTRGVLFWLKQPSTVISGGTANSTVSGYSNKNYTGNLVSYTTAETGGYTGNSNGTPKTMYYYVKYESTIGVLAEVSGSFSVPANTLVNVMPTFTTNTQRELLTSDETLKDPAISTRKYKISVGASCIDSADNTKYWANKFRFDENGSTGATLSTNVQEFEHSPGKLYTYTPYVGLSSYSAWQKGNDITMDLRRPTVSVSSWHTVEGRAGSQKMTYTVRASSVADSTGEAFSFDAYYVKLSDSTVSRYYPLSAASKGVDAITVTRDVGPNAPSVTATVYVRRPSWDGAGVWSLAASRTLDFYSIKPVVEKCYINSFRKVVLKWTSLDPRVGALISSGAMSVAARIKDSSGRTHGPNYEVITASRNKEVALSTVLPNDGMYTIQVWSNIAGRESSIVELPLRVSTPQVTNVNITSLKNQEITFNVSGTNIDKDTTYDVSVRNMEGWEMQYLSALPSPITVKDLPENGQFRLGISPMNGNLRGESWWKIIENLYPTVEYHIVPTNTGYPEIDVYSSTYTTGASIKNGTRQFKLNQIPTQGNVSLESISDQYTNTMYTLDLHRGGNYSPQASSGVSIDSNAIDIHTEVQTVYSHNNQIKANCSKFEVSGTSQSPTVSVQYLITTPQSGRAVLKLLFVPTAEGDTRILNEYTTQLTNSTVDLSHTWANVDVSSLPTAGGTFNVELVTTTDYGINFNHVTTSDTKVVFYRSPVYVVQQNNGTKELVRTDIYIKNPDNTLSSIFVCAVDGTDIVTGIREEVN